MSQEIWKSVIGIENGFYDGLYEVSNLGRWKLLPRKLPNSRGEGFRTTKEKITTGTNSHGYRTVILKKNRIKKQIGLHILSAKAFLPNPQDFAYVNHKDGNRWNNTIENLEWCTPKENSRHAWDMGLIKATKGEERSTAKLTESQVKTMRDIYEGGEYSYVKLGAMFGICASVARDVVTRKKWKHVA